jgi:hypothetical protein
MKVWHLLIKVAERLNSRNTGLNFIEEKQGCPWDDPLPIVGRKKLADLDRIQRLAENLINPGILFQIDLEVVRKFPAKLPYNKGFPNLPGTTD